MVCPPFCISDFSLWKSWTLSAAGSQDSTLPDPLLSVQRHGRTVKTGCFPGCRIPRWICFSLENYRQTPGKGRRQGLNSRTCLFGQGDSKLVVLRRRSTPFYGRWFRPGCRNGPAVALPGVPPSRGALSLAADHAGASPQTVQSGIHSPGPHLRPCRLPGS